MSLAVSTGPSRANVSINSYDILYAEPVPFLLVGLSSYNTVESVAFGRFAKVLW